MAPPWWVAPLLIVVAVVAAGCSSTPSSGDAVRSGQTEVPVLVSSSVPVVPATVTDVDGKQVTVRDTSRIVSLNGGVSETLVAMGLAGNMVGRDVSSDFPELNEVAIVTNGHDVSAEGVLSLEPTVVLADSRTGPPESLTTIENAGVPVVRVPEVWSLADVAKRVDAVAAAVGRPSAAQEINARIEADLASVEKPNRQDAPVVAFLYLRGTAAVYLLGGRGSGGDDMIAAAGGVDAGSLAGLDNFTPLTPEALVSSAPDVILVMTKGLESVGGRDGLLQLPGVAATPAGQSGRIVAVPDGELLSFGPRTPATVRNLAAQIHSGEGGSAS